MRGVRRAIAVRRGRRTVGRIGHTTAQQRAQWSQQLPAHQPPLELPREGDGDTARDGQQSNLHPRPVVQGAVGGQRDRGDTPH